MSLNPTLFGAINADAYAHDEVDGPGVNWYLEAPMLDAAECFLPLVSGADFWEDVEINILGENREAEIRKELRELAVREW